jgi:hypothetical protein
MAQRDTWARGKAKMNRDRLIRTLMTHRENQLLRGQPLMASWHRGWKLFDHQEWLSTLSDDRLATEYREQMGHDYTEAEETEPCV